jgi:hypothetical protein
MIGGKNERSCKHCVAAGGYRAERAKWCRGSVWAKKCTFLHEAGNMEGSNMEAERDGRSSTETRPPVTPKGTSLGEYFAPSAAKTVVIGGVSCESCVAAGGERKQEAAWCEGRIDIVQCPFATHQERVTRSVSMGVLLTQKRKRISTSAQEFEEDPLPAVAEKAVEVRATQD